MDEKKKKKEKKRRGEAEGERLGDEQTSPIWEGAYPPSPSGSQKVAANPCLELGEAPRGNKKVVFE